MAFSSRPEEPYPGILHDYSRQSLLRQSKPPHHILQGHCTRAREAIPVLHSPAMTPSAHSCCACSTSAKPSQHHQIACPPTPPQPFRRSTWFSRYATFPLIGILGTAEDRKPLRLCCPLRRQPSGVPRPSPHQVFFQIVPSGVSSRMIPRISSWSRMASALSQSRFSLAALRWTIRSSTSSSLG